MINRTEKKREKRVAALVSAIDAIKEDYNDSEALRALNASDVRDEVKEAFAALQGALRKREQNRRDILDMVSSATASMEIERLLESLMPRLIETTKSAFGAFYLANNAAGKLEIKSSFGFGRNVFTEFDLTIGEGLIGQAAAKHDITVVNDLPDDSVYVTKTILGAMKPKTMMLVPVFNQDTLLGVLALGSLREYTADEFELVDIIKYYVGAAVANSVIYERSRRQARELEFQNSLIQGLNSELEKKVAERGILLNDTLNSIKDYAIYTTDSEGTVLLWNAGAEISFGYSAEDAIGQDISRLLKADEFANISLKKRISEVRANGRYSEEGWRRRGDGAICYVSSSVFGMYNHEKELVGFTHIAHDITELKNSQDELMLERDLNDKLFEYANRPGLIIDYNDVVLKTNLRSREFFDNLSRGCLTGDGRVVEPLGDLEGKNLSDFFDDITPVRICVELSDGLGTCDLTTTDGRLVHVEMLGVRDSNGYFVRLVIMINE